MGFDEKSRDRILLAYRTALIADRDHSGERGRNCGSGRNEHDEAEGADKRFINCDSCLRIRGLDRSEMPLLCFHLSNDRRGNVG